MRLYLGKRLEKNLSTSALLTVTSVTLIVIFSAFVAYVMQRRNDRVASWVNSVMFAGLVLPPAVVPTVFWMQTIGIYKTIIGLVFIEVALSMPFAILILCAFIGTIPKEIDEAAIMDGASPSRLFFSSSCHFLDQRLQPVSLYPQSPFTTIFPILYISCPALKILLSKRSFLIL